MGGLIIWAVYGCSFRNCLSLKGEICHNEATTTIPCLGVIVNVSSTARSA